MSTAGDSSVSAAGMSSGNVRSWGIKTEVSIHRSLVVKTTIKVTTHSEERGEIQVGGDGDIGLGRLSVVSISG